MQLCPMKYFANASFGTPMGKKMLSRYFPAPGKEAGTSPHTSFARRNTAHAFGQPTYIPAWVIAEAISSLVTPFAFAFCR